MTDVDDQEPFFVDHATVHALSDRADNTDPCIRLGGAVGAAAGPRLGRRAGRADRHPVPGDQPSGQRGGAGRSGGGRRQRCVHGGVVVTGANRCMGQKVARRCAASGDTVVLGARRESSGPPLRQLAKAGLSGRVLARVLDVTNQPGWLIARTGGRAGCRRRADRHRRRLPLHRPDRRGRGLAVVREALETNGLGGWPVTLAPATTATPQPT